MFFFSERNSPQRSIDYPCIIRKPPKLSDLVRKRLLFKKVSRGITQLGETFSSSVEKEHVPKVPRKIIIKQDNSIELGLRKPPKLRVQAASLDMSLYSHFSESTTTTFENQIKQPSMLSVASSNSFNDRRKTIETCENIFLQSEESTKLRAKTPPSNPHRILLYKDPSNKSIRSTFFLLSRKKWVFDPKIPVISFLLLIKNLHFFLLKVNGLGMRIVGG
jgi:hypothetical protein